MYFPELDLIRVKIQLSYNQLLIKKYMLRILRKSYPAYRLLWFVK